MRRDIVDKTITPVGGQIDIDGDGINEFLFVTGSVLNSTGLVISGLQAENRVLKKNGELFAQVISTNTVVGLQLQVFEQTIPLSVLFCSTGGGCLYSSPFINVNTSEVFMGVQFLKDGLVHNGMIGLTMFVGSGSISVQEYYYESIPGELLLIPAPGVLSMLLLVPVFASRRHRRG